MSIIYTTLLSSVLLPDMRHSTTSKRMPLLPLTRRVVPILLVLGAWTPWFMTDCAVAQSTGQTDAPPVEVREIHVKKDRPDESFPKAGTSLTLWVRDTLGTFSSVVADETTISAFRDDAGTDLIAAHEDAIVAWKEKKKRLKNEGRFVSTSRARELYETEGFGGSFSEGVSGFYLTIESWGLPSSDATALHVEGTVTYVLGLDEMPTKRFSDLVLGETSTLEAEDQTIEVTNSSARNDRQRFRLESPLSIEKFQIRDEQDEEIGSIQMTVNDQPVVDMPKEAYNTPVTVVMTYKKPKIRTVTVDETVSVGLP